MQAFDAAWHERALSGDPAAIDLLVDHAMGPLYRFCLYRVGRDTGLCQDVVHETLARAIKDLSGYEPVRSEGRILPWLNGLARNEVRRALKQVPTAASLEAMWERMDQELLAVYAKLEQEPFSDADLQRTETRELVNATMAQIPDHYRETLEAKYLEGSSVRDLAGRLGVTERAAESQLARARKAFRATFMTLVRNLSVETA